jgi:L-2-hydroxyglutarate oxidase LhgO
VTDNGWAAEVAMERVGTVVVGGGVVGCAVARELAEAGAREVFLLEAMSNLGEVQSGRNSGVVHAGLYYATGSLKAALCVEGNALVYEFCRAHGVPVAPVGKLVVACDEGEIEALAALHAQALANGLPDVRMLTRDGVRALEPNVDVPAALHLPSTGIVDAAGLTRALARRAEAAGATVLTSFEVIGIEPRGGVFEVTGRRGGREETVAAEALVNAAGLHCDEVARMVDPECGAEVVPLRGEYCRVNRRRRPGVWMNGMNVYPVPEWLDVLGEPAKMVGVHLTPTFALARDGSVAVGDTVTVGPEFVRVAGRDDYERGRKPPEHFLARARRFFPSLERADLELDFAGIMVHLQGANDFVIRRDRRHAGCVHLLGIDSPGLTSALAIARRVGRMLLA